MREFDARNAAGRAGYAGPLADEIQRERSALLLEAIEKLAGAGGMDDVVAILRATARRLIDADGIAVILREDEQCWYVEEDAMGPLWKGHRFPLASCISGWAMVHKETVVIDDIREDSRIPQELYRDTFVRGLLMVPVRSDDPIGAIGAYWSDCYRATREQVDIVERVARATATAMENVRLIAALSKALSDAELARDELRHRVKNAFTAAQALATLTLPVEHHRALNARIAALSRAHALLDERLAHQDSINLVELIEAELAPYSSDDSGRFQVAGDGDVCLDSTRAVALGLAINELATNALKYGALSTDQGRLDVRWRSTGGSVVLEWRESDGPEVRAGSENVGSRLLKRLIEGQLRGTIDRQLESDGVTCVVRFPLDGQQHRSTGGAHALQ